MKSNKKCKGSDTRLHVAADKIEQVNFFQINLSMHKKNIGHICNKVFDAKVSWKTKS